MGPTPNAEVPSMRCSPPEPLVVMAKRNRDVLPFCGVRYMFVVVLLPKSKMRVQLAVEFNLTQVSMVQLLSVLTIAGGKLTYCSRRDRPGPPRQRREMGHSQGPTLRQLQEFRLRYSHRYKRRHLRPVPRP